MKKLLFLLLLVGCNSTSSNKFNTGDIVVTRLKERGVVVGYFNGWVQIDFKGRSELTQLPENLLTLEVEQ